ncbi:AAA family ATPase [Leptolyngbya sp. PCC 6406]|uniref:AAA family ATPase n=1 Tax=Leptolyngbya sp. PCC 6406 TaxID=1173264 RepID=UPI0002ABB14C|nr:AAA family ATPase [Leptolyngbya sp. PCC 6406]
MTSLILSQLAGYTALESIYQGNRTTVYRGRDIASQQSVIIKVLSQEYPSFGELIQFRHQYAVTQNLAVPGITSPLGLEPWGNGYALIMEDFGGVDLGQYAQQHPLTLTDTLSIGLQLATILHDLHQARVIHKDIKPANILIHPETKEVTLIDFSIASLLPKETPTLQSPQSLEGTLAYLAPEQTGRMNRGIDYRTDFYALGVTLYQLLTGELPFSSDDPLGMIHSHLAQMPTPVDQVNRAVPAMVAAIVAKLMAKNAEDRYQSALGLQQDLHQCLSQWQDRGEISAFPLGQRDISDRFLIPEKLYGREKEVQTLLQAFDRVAEGSSELLLVAGFSGIGKTAVINEVHKPIVRQRGYFIKGKFDQFNRNIPFSAFVQAFRDLVGQLLSESDAQLQLWKVQILGALEGNAQVIIDLIPELARIIGPQPPAPELSGEAAQNRFNLLFQSFIQVFTTPEHPLVIFIDDLQWADLASLGLMQCLLTEAQCKYLLVLGAYRDNEVFPGHPFLITVNELRKTEVSLQTIVLRPLDADSLSHLIADAFHAPQAIVQPLTELVIQKTQGNPFFATQFLKALYQDSLITFDQNARHWQCDLVQVHSAALTNDVVEFMALQLQKLPAATQGQLTFAACIGAQFDLKTLSIVSEQSQTEVATALWSALQAGVILPTNKIYRFYGNDSQSDYNSAPKDDFSGQVNYRFLHDRIQQASYSLIPAEQKQQTHYRIATLLQQNLTESEQEERLFAIINHVNLSRTLVTAATQRTELSQFNLRAARKAKAATAYGAALEYLSIGIELLPTDDWQQEYALTLALHREMVEACYLNADFEQMEQWAEISLQQAKTVLDRVPIYEAKIQACVAQNQLGLGIETALVILGELGIDLPDNPTPEDVGAALGGTHALLAEISPPDLVDLPLMTDDWAQAKMRILSSMFGAAYNGRPLLLPLTICQQVELSWQYGNTELSAFAYASYGLILCAFTGVVERSYQFGKLGLALMDKLNAPQLCAKIEGIFNNCIRHWQDPLQMTLKSFLKGYETGLATGDVEWAVWCIFGYGFYAYCSGKELLDLEKELASHGAAITRLKQTTALRYHQMYHQAVLNLIGNSENPDCLVGSSYDETQMRAQHLQVNDRPAIYHLHVNKLILSFLFGKYDQAIAEAAIAEQYLDGVPGLFVSALLPFYDSLAQLAGTQRTDDDESPAIHQRLQRHLEKLQGWADLAPSNYLHKLRLVEAEHCRVLGQRYEALEKYDQSIAAAKDNGYLQEEAIANELAAKFYLAWGKERVAAGYMQDAYYCYSRWGAKAKVLDLETLYHDLLRPILKPSAPVSDVFSNLMTITQQKTSFNSESGSDTGQHNFNQTFDFANILQASQTLSGTLKLDELLHQLTQIILQNSGGDLCALILPKDTGIWQVRAISTQQETRLCTETLDHNTTLPTKLIQYVRNTQEVVVIDNLETNLPVLDDYLQTQQPQSILGLPILNQGRCIGILYLQNSLTRGVFTHERTAALSFLCTQAAISLENAQLYQEVDNLAQALRQALDFNTQALNKTQLQLQLALDSSNIGLWDWDIQSDEMLFDEQWKQLLGHIHEYEPQPSVTEWESRVHPEDLEIAKMGMAQHLQGKTSMYENEHRIRCKDGLYKWICAKGRVVEWDESEHPLRFIGTFTDISDRKQIELALTEVSAQLRKAQDIAQLGHWSCDLVNQTISWSAEVFQIFGRSLEQGEPNFEEYVDYIHPEDRAQAVDQLTIASQGVSQNFDHRIVHPDGTVRHINCRTELELQGGQAVRLFGVVMDITDRRVAELELERFFTISLDLLCIADTGGHFRRLNQAWQDILGYPSAELEGQVFLNFVHPEDIDDTLAAVSTLDEGQTVIKFTNRYRTKAGTYRHIEWLSVPQGELIYAAARDITERVEAQAKLEALLSSTQLLNDLSHQIRQSLDLDQIIETAVDAVFNQIEVDICTCVRYWKENGHPYSEVIRENRRPEMASWLGTYDLAEFPAYHQALLRNQVFTFDRENLGEVYDPGIDRFCESVGITRYLMVPIQTSGERLCLELGRVAGRPGWQADEIDLLESLGTQIAIAVQQADLYQTAQRQTQELKTAYQELQETQVQLIQAEKMSSLGQLVAGIAHEINNPVSFIYGNLEPLAGYANNLLDIIRAYQNTYPQPTPELIDLVTELDLPFIVDDLPKTLESMKTGASRIRDIVKSLRTFSRLDEAQLKAVDLHENIDSTLMILQNQLNGRSGNAEIKIIKNYGNLSNFECHIGLLNQVFMNLLVNGIDAIEERQQIERNSTYQGVIVITTHQDESGMVSISVQDNGMGMTERVKTKIFEPFFTTKSVGSGTGMGLPTSHQIVTKYHQGEINFDSTLGEGTTFNVRLPPGLIGQ